MRNKLRTVFAVVGALALILGLGFALDFANLKQTEFFAPKYAAVDRKVFEESAAYNEGMIRDLENIKREYIMANDEQKLALKATALHRFAAYPIDRMPEDLQTFYRSLQ